MTRTEWLLGGLLALLFVLVAGLGLFLWFQPELDLDTIPTVQAVSAIADDARAPTPRLAGETALVAFGRAQSMATDWQPDATLLTARATWPQGADRSALLSGSADWTLTFYSPAEQALWTTAVVGGTVRPGTVRTANQTQDPAQLLRWRLDSDDAVEIFMVSGGDAFLREAQITTLTMSLEMDVEASRAEWLISLFAPGNGMTLTMRVDAETGDVVAISGIETPES